MGLQHIRTMSVAINSYTHYARLYLVTLDNLDMHIWALNSRGGVMHVCVDKYAHINLDIDLFSC